MAQQSQGAPEHLPAFKTPEECLAYTQEKQDDFYPTAFMIEAWVGDVTGYALEHYSQHKSGHRILQTGMAWQSWNRVFGHAQPDEWDHILTSVGRFSRCDAPESELIQHTLALLALENLHGEPASLSAFLERNREAKLTWADAMAKMRYCFRRMADWLEALAHWQAHTMATMAPITLQPTEEKRELIQIGLMQRNYARLNQHGKDWWQFRHQSLAEKFHGKSDLGLIGKAQANDKWGAPKRPHVDELAIHWWPLLVRYGWTDRDMRLLMRRVVNEPEQYPLREDKEFADYRQKILGLKKDKTTQDKSSGDGRPVGWKVAMAMVNRLEA